MQKPDDDMTVADGVNPFPEATLVDAPQDGGLHTDLPNAAVDLRIHDSLHRYELGDVIGQGGMSTVLRATDINLGRPMALKYLHGQDSDPRTARLVREARITAQLQHPGIVPVHELTRDAEGTVFYTMSLVEGRSLGEILTAIGDGDAEAAKAFPLARLLTIYQRACDAVAYAHSRGIVHRDLKPDNLMVGEYGSVLVIDWGVARVLRNGEADQNDPLTSEPNDPESTPDDGPGRGIEVGDGAMLTMAGALVGTPRYMAPEQAAADSETVDERTDVYGLGGILYSILTLRPPVVGRDAEDTIVKAISGTIPDPGTYGKSTTTRLRRRPRSPEAEHQHRGGSGPRHVGRRFCVQSARTDPGRACRARGAGAPGCVACHGAGPRQRRQGLHRKGTARGCAEARRLGHLTRGRR